MTDASDKSAKGEKQKLWERIASRPDHLVLARMRIHGFWPADMGLPEDPADEAAARAKLEAARTALLQTALVVKDPTEALKKENLRRIEESRARRAEARKRREEERAARRAAWVKEKAQGAMHLGLEVSARLVSRQSDVARLSAAGLPVLHDAAGLAAAIGMPLPTLRWLTFHRRGATIVHYHRYDVPKKTGGMRGISAPKKKLKDAQHWVLTHVLAHLRTDEHAHGFVPGRSIVTNARPHTRRAVVVNLDLKDFFPSIHFRRVRGLFEAVGYSGQVATVLALLCTEPPRIAVRVDGDAAGKLWHVALGERQLPQGAPTSPALTNALCHRLDRRLAGVARALGFSYTRYADDLTFSGDDAAGTKVLLARVRRTVEDEGFTENEDKTRVMRRGRRQEVTGVVVNDRPTVARHEVRRLRAILHNAARLGLESQNRDKHPAFASHLAGKVAYVKMVDPRRGAQLSLLLQRALGTQNATPGG